MALRAWTEADLDAYLDLYSRWDVMRWLGRQPRRALADRDEARLRLSAWVERTESLQPPLGLWALLQQSAGAAAVPIGTVLLLPLTAEDGSSTETETEIGWHLHPDHQGSGLVTEAAAALLAAGATAGLTRVLALTAPDNERSQAVARRLGMHDDGLTDSWFGLTTLQFVWHAVAAVKG